MAGGQGTRLGHKGPKGTFKVDVKDGEKYLFQIIVESLQKANEKYGIVIPWYLMTSEENNDQTLAFLEEHNYFGYPQEKVKLFKQGKTKPSDYCYKHRGYSKQENRILICIDCKKEFIAGSKSREKCRCKECQTVYRRKYKAEMQRKYRK